MEEIGNLKISIVSFLRVNFFLRRKTKFILTHTHREIVKHGGSQRAGVVSR